MSRRPLYPPAAPAWMVSGAASTGGPARVLDLASGSGAFAELVAAEGHRVFCLDRDVEAVAGVRERLGTAVHVVGQVESLPYGSRQFDVVTASQALHRFAPGLALSEIARVLRPGGHVAVAYNTRDDTVPWVRRLAAIVREADPEAMKGDFGVDSVDAVADSPYFGDLTRRDFRNWIPIRRAGLIAMVDRLPSTATLEPAVRDRLLRDVGALYDSSARPPEPLLLPYRASCWRAEVDHAALDLAAEEDALPIKL